MEKRYEETWALATRDCDRWGEWRPGAILEAMQDTAAVHCERLGIGRPVMDGLGIAWVLCRAEVKLGRVPRYGERVTVQTWPLPTKHLFYPRINAFFDAEGREIGAATSLWALLDIARRRIVNSDVVLAHLPENADMPGGAPGNVRPLEGAAEAREFLPAYSDFDLNGHVNNTKYLDWTTSALGHDAMAAHRVKRFAVSYDTEVLPGQAVRAELVRAGERFSYCGWAAGRRCFAVSGELEKR